MCRRKPPLVSAAPAFPARCCPPPQRWVRGASPHRGGPAPSSSDSYKLIADAVNKRGFSAAPIPKGLGSANASLHIYQPAKTAQGRVRGSKFKRVAASPLKTGPCCTTKHKHTPADNSSFLELSRMQKAGEVTKAQGFSSLPTTCSSRAGHRTQLRATQTLEVALKPSGEHLLLPLAPDTKGVPWKATAGSPIPRWVLIEA